MIYRTRSLNTIKDSSDTISWVLTLETKLKPSDVHTRVLSPHPTRKFRLPSHTTFVPPGVSVSRTTVTTLYHLLTGPSLTQPQSPIPVLLYPELPT